MDYEYEQKMGMERETIAYLHHIPQKDMSLVMAMRKTKMIWWIPVETEQEIGRELMQAN